MNLSVSEIYQPLFTTKARYILLYGGRAGGRSYAASQRILFDTRVNKYSRAAVMRYILGDVRDSVWTEIKDRIEENGLPDVTSDQAMRYEFNGNQINGKGFKKSSSQNTAKLKSLASYNLVWIEEAEEIEEDDFVNLDSSIRTANADNVIILSFNMPPKDHWILRYYFDLVDSDVPGYYRAVPKDREDVEYIFATYKDNAKNLPASLIRTYEALKDTNPEYYYTMIQGLVSEGVTGRVYTNWNPISPEEYEKLPYTEYYGLDFGFTNDPTALVGFKTHNKDVWVRELIYKNGLTNQDISKEMEVLEVNGEIIGDSAEPKSIEEIFREGFNINPSVKGADSIRAGISLLNEYNVHYTNDSENLKKEYQNYVYALDRDKNPTNKPEDRNNHCMDAIRYIAQHVLTTEDVSIVWF